MPHPLELDRIAVVLVRARNPNNIGAVARAMHDFGFRDLRVVNEYPLPLEGARAAVDASAVLEAATVYQVLGEAVADCTLVVGTTAVGERKLHHPLFTLSEAATKLRDHAASAATGETQPRVALLFGSEKTGLSNEELSHCHWLLTIPMHQHDASRHLSMNLGQAVAVCLYEVVRNGDRDKDGDRNTDQDQGQNRPSAHSPAVSAAATANELERVSTLLAEVLEASDYLRHHPANSSSADIRRMVRRMDLSGTDAPVWMGVLRQILWKLRC